MVYILDQRLRAQNIPDEKAKKGTKLTVNCKWVGYQCSTKSRYEQM